MKKKQRIASKIPTTKTNTNRKKSSESAESATSIEPSLFKKNEFALILFGALLLTLIVFFVFFQSSDKKTADKTSSKSDSSITKGSNKSPSFADLEKRIQALETALLDKTGSKNNATSGNVNLNPVTDRVNRLETALDVKFATLTERMENIEKNVESFNKKTTSKIASIQKSTPQKKTPTLTKPAIKKVSTTSQKAPMFHTVKKGETLYSISKKYKISVSSLQKINKLTATSKIYPGMNILIR